MNESTSPAYTAVPVIERRGNTEAPQNERPLSYFDVVTQIKEAKIKSKGSRFDFAKRVCSIFCGSFIFTILLIIALVYPISLIFSGVKNLNRCPINQFIPIWFLSTGCAALALSIIKFTANMLMCSRFSKTREVNDCFCSCCRKKSDYVDIQILNYAEAFLSAFLFGCLLIGSFMVFRIKHEVEFDDETDEDFCDQSCYLYAYRSLITTWVLLAISSICLCGIICKILTVKAFCCPKKSNDDN